MDEKPRFAISVNKKEVLKNEKERLLATWSILDKEEMPKVQKFFRWHYPLGNEPEVILFNKLRLAVYNPIQYRVNGRSLINSLFGQIPEEKALKKLGRLLGKLEAALIEYVSHSELTENEFVRNRVLISGLKKRRNTELLHREAKNFSEILEAAPATIMRKADMWWLSHQLYYHQSINQHTNDSSFFGPALNDLFTFFKLSTLRYYCEYLNRHNLLKSDLEAATLRQYYQLIIQEESRDEPAIQLYQSAAELLSNRDSKPHYREYRVLFSEHFEMLAIPDQLVLLKYGLNTAFYQYEKGDEDMREEMFFWSFTGVEKRIFFFEGVMKADEYINVALSAAAVGKFDIQLSFMEQCKPYLENKEEAEKAYQLTLAYYHFFQGSYHKTLAILNDIYPRYITGGLAYTLRANTLQICCYLALTVREKHYDSDHFENAAESFRKFISREGILSAEKKKPFQNFLIMCNAIFKFHFKELMDKSRKEPGKVRLLAKLEKFERITSKPWLKKLIREL